MQLIQLRRPLQAAAARACRPSLSSTPTFLSDLFSQLRLDGGSKVEGRRYASVKSQGAYKLKWKRTIPKKMGAKRTGDQYVIPGNIIYKQRGTIWHPGENTIMGRNHTIHAAVAGYVKYYRDPALHPTRQYIGVTFNRDDKLPYPRNAMRRRKLGLVATQRKAEAPQPDVTGPSGIPLWIVRREGQTATEFELATSGTPEAAETPAEQAEKAKKSRKSQAKLRAARLMELRQKRRQVQRETRVLHLQPDYSYREYNWEIGRLIGPTGRPVPGSGPRVSRKAKMRARRRKTEHKYRVLSAETKKRKVRHVAYMESVAKGKAARAADEAAQAAKSAAKAKLGEGKKKA